MKNDVWSYGVMLFCCVETLFPFDSSTDTEVEKPKLRPSVDDAPPQLDFTEERWGDAFAQRVRLALPSLLQPKYSERLDIKGAMRQLSPAVENGVDDFLVEELVR